MTPENVSEMKSMSVFVPEDLADDFAQLAKRHERSVSAEMRRAMRAHLEADLLRDGESNGGAA